MPSPVRESIASFQPLGSTPLHPPPSPGTHRGLRRLQSAHSLGAKAANPPSLIAQQRQQLQFQQQHQLPPPQSQSHQSQSQSHTQQTQGQQHPTGNQHGLSRHQSSGSPVRRNALNNNTSRHRANSDAASPPAIHQQGVSHSVPQSPTAKRSALNRRSLAADGLSLDRLLRDGPPGGDIAGSLESARLKILDQGIKSDGDGMSSLRIYVWLILLNAPVLDTDAYLSLIHRGASPAYSKIRNDTFRTLTTDPLFRRRVSEASLIRLLNAIAWRLYDSREDQRTKDSCSSTCGSRYSLPFDNRPSSSSTRPGSSGSALVSSPASKGRSRALTLTTEGSESSMIMEPGTYVQGMNVLAAPFLYAARSEAEAFIAFHKFLTYEIPGYIRGAMDGVHKGLALVDKVLAIVDPKLSLYLLSKSLTAEIYAFPSVLTLCACTPPLPEVLRLWDFLLAYGPHLNILCIVAQLVMIRTQIMNSPSPNKLLRAFPALQADQIKRTTLAIIKMIPDDVYSDIVTHAQ